MSSETARWSKSVKSPPSSDSRLKFAYLKLESLVIADQHAAVNMFLSLVHTARQATRIGSILRHVPNRKEGSAKGKSSEGD